MADVLSHVSTWRKMLYDLGEAEVKHGVMLHIYNLCSDEIGYRELPHLLGKKTAMPSAQGTNAEAYNTYLQGEYFL